MNRPSVEATHFVTFLALWAACPSTISTTGFPSSRNRRWQNSRNLAAFMVPSTMEKRSRPCAETAEIMFTLNRAPVVFTTGVRPTGAQVVPAW